MPYPYLEDWEGGQNQQSGLPQIPSQGGIPLGAGNTVNPIGGLPNNSGKPPVDPNQAKIDKLREITSSRLYRMGIALGGKDWAGPTLAGLENRQLAQQELEQRKSEGQTRKDATNAQIAGHGADLISKFQDYLERIPEEDRDKHAEQFVPIIQSVYKPLLRKGEQEVLMDPEVIKRGLTSRDYMKALQASRPFLDENDWQTIKNSAKDRVGREKVAESIVDQKVQPLLGEIAKAVKTLPPKEDGSRYTLAEAKAAFAGDKTFDAKHEAALSYWFSNRDPKHVDQFLSSLNIMPLSAETKKEVKGGAQKLSDLGLNQNIGPYLGQAGWDAKYGAATPENLMNLSKSDPTTYGQIVTKAEQLRKAAEVKAATEIGVGIQKGAIVATNAELLDMPLTDPRVPGSADWESKRFIYDSSGRPVSAANFTGRQLRDARNVGQVAVLDDKEHIAVQGANVALGTINKFGQIAEQLPEGAGQNFRKLATERLKNLLGKDNLQAQLDGMRTSVMTAVRGAQGSAQNISNKDVEQVQRSFTTLWDGKQSARARLTAYRDLVNLSRDASLRRLDPAAIQSKWESIMKNMDEGSVTGATRVR